MNLTVKEMVSTWIQMDPPFTLCRIRVL